MKRILVADDHMPLCEAISEILQSSGYTVIIASDGQIAIDMAQQHLPDLVLCDVKMPVYNGYEVTLALSQNINTADIPILMLTGDTDELRHNYNLQDNIRGYITKPFNALNLIDLVDEHLSN